MKVAARVQDVSGHMTSLLTSLNLQRERALFCDCVVRQRQSPGQLYPAHRCILAASSPVLASVLSSTGALVELQDPCLSGSVLAILLDYIYTGALPCTCSQQQYNSLLTAAFYLQMSKLQEALCAWQQTKLNNSDETNASPGTENQAYKNIISTHSETADAFNECLPSTCSTDACRRVEETDTCFVKTTASSQEGASVGKYDITQVHSESIDLCIKEAETNTCGTHSITGAKCCNRKDASTLTESSGNAGDCREVIHLTAQAEIQNIPNTSKGYSVSTVDKDMQTDQFYAAGSIKPETWQKSTEEELEKTVEVRRSASSSPSSLQHPCSGAVPVICHSSRAAMLQLVEVCTEPCNPPVSRTSGDFSGISASRSARIENENIVEEITTEHKSNCEIENLVHRTNKANTETQRDSLDLCDTQDSCYKSNMNQSDTLKQDYTCSNTNHLLNLNDRQEENGLSHITDHNDHHANCDYNHNKNQTKYYADVSVPQNKVCSSFIRGLKFKTDLSFDHLPSKHQRLDWSDRDVSMSAAAMVRSQDPTVVAALPVQDSDTGSDSHCEDFWSEGEVKEEQNCSSTYLSEMKKHCNLSGPKADWNQRLREADTSRKDATSSQHEYDSDNRDTVMEDERRSADVCLHVSNTPESNLDNVTGGLSAFEHHTLLDLEKISDTETSEPQFTFTFPVGSNTPDSMYGAVGHSYHGHVHYHCLSQEETHLSHVDSDRKHSHPRYSGHSDQSSDDETFASPGKSPLRQHFATRTPEQVLLLDISTKHAELLVSYKHRDDQEKKAFDKKDTFGTGIEYNDRATPVAGVAKTKVRPRTTFGKSLNESRNKPWLREANVKERKVVDRAQSRLGPEVKNKARAVEVSKHEEDEKQTSTLTGCSACTVPESVQASMSSTFSVCIPSSLPASTSTNISAHLSTPVHHAFQCSLCDRSFSQRGSLNRHVRSHLGVRPFPCPCCPMTFSRQYRVTEHMRVHQRCTLGNDLPKLPASSI